MYFRLSVSRRLLLVVMIGLITPAVIVVHSLINLRRTLVDLREAEVKHLDEGAWTIVSNFYERSLKGELTEATAKDAARAAIRGMHYDASNYFFIWDIGGNSIVNGGNPSLEGKNFLDGPDATANPHVSMMARKLILAVQDGEGFARYRHPKAGQSTELEKISYSKLFKPWGWAIGTGAYLEDIDAAFWAEAKAATIITVSLTLIAGLLSSMIGLELSRSLYRLAEATKDLVAGKMNVMIPFVGRDDEIGTLAATVQAFKDSAIRTKVLEAQQLAEQKAASDAAKLVVNCLATGLERLAAGDLSYRIGTVLPTAYEKIGTDFNEAVGHLAGLTQNLVTNMSIISAESHEIADSTDDLSRRIEQQTVQLKSAAVALGDVTAGVRYTANHSSHVQSIATAALNEVTCGQSVMGDAVKAIGEIAKSSERISCIIAVIDAIAAQSGLLALNATIEAAQAGDAGRGFTVVAAEVRALALRSTEAAQEIKTVVKDSTRYVAQGVMLVGKTGESLARIVGQVERVSHAMQSIVDVTHEQATSLHQVDETIRRLDQVSQENATLVERSAAGGHALMKEAVNTAALTARFNLDATIPEQTHQYEVREEPFPSSRAQVVRRPAAA